VCGRFTNIADGDELVERFGVRLVPGFSERHQPRFNVAPAQRVPVVVETAEGRELRPMRWGLVPHWARKDARAAFKMINAKAETLLEKPAYRGLVKAHRCLIPADGFYEWQRAEDGRKRPVRFTLADGSVFGFAGLWTGWLDETGWPQESCVLVTTRPNALVGAFHDRMPVILPAALEADWLDPEISAEHAVSLLRPYPAELMRAAPASALVNSVGNDGPELLEAAA
jgi:putative SOS response-associated peptidase YedK